MENNISFQSLFELANKDNAFYIDLLESLIQTSEAGIAQIRKGIAENTPLEIAEIAHRIASPLKHIGAYKTNRQLHAIEEKCREGAELNEFKHTIEETLNEINALLPLIHAEITQHN